MWNGQNIVWDNRKTGDHAYLNLLLPLLPLVQLSIYLFLSVVILLGNSD